MDIKNSDKNILLIIADHLEKFDYIFKSLEKEEFVMLKTDYKTFQDTVKEMKNLQRENILIIIHDHLNQNEKHIEIKNYFSKKLNISNPHFLILNPDMIKIKNSSSFEKEQNFYYNFPDDNSFAKDNSFYLFLKMIFYRMRDISRLDNYIINSFRTIIDSEIMKKQKKEIEKLYKELEVLSKTDYLTRVLNRRAFFEKMEKDLFKNIKNSGNFSRKSDDIGDKTAFACIMIDIDHFKKVNDTHGHLSGDIVLKELGNLLKSKKIFRANDIIGRYGGEEFIIILRKSTSKEAKIPAERLRNEIKKIEFKDEKGEVFNVNISLGISEYRINDKSSISIINRADKALYYAKQHGRDQTAVYEEVFSEK